MVTRLADAEQIGEVAVATRLGKNALARIDEDYCEVGGRRPGDYVAGKLFRGGD